MEGKLSDLTKAPSWALHFEVFLARCHFPLQSAWRLLVECDHNRLPGIARRWSPEVVSMSSGVSSLQIYYHFFLSVFFYLFIFFKEDAPPPPLSGSVWISCRRLPAFIRFYSLIPLLEAPLSQLASLSDHQREKRGKCRQREWPPSIVFQHGPLAE